MQNLSVVQRQKCRRWQNPTTFTKYPETRYLSCALHKDFLRQDLGKLGKLSYLLSPNSDLKTTTLFLIAMSFVDVFYEPMSAAKYGHCPYLAADPSGRMRAEFLPFCVPLNELNNEFLSGFICSLCRPPLITEFDMTMPPFPLFVY